MPGQDFNPSRRAFLGNALKLGTGSLLLGSSLPGGAAEKTDSTVSGSQPLAVLPELPTRVLIQHDDSHFQTADRKGSRFASDHAAVDLVNTPVTGQEVRVTCPDRAVVARGSALGNHFSW